MGWGSIVAQGVQGYLKGTQFREQREQDAEDRAWRTESRDRQRQDWRDQDELKANLKGAATRQDVVEGSGGAVLPETMDNRDVGQPGEQPLIAQQFRVGQQGYDTRNAAQSAADAYNSPAAISGRMADVYMAAGQPEKALALDQRRAAFEKAQEEYKAKGIDTALRAFRAGDKKGAVAGLRKSGMFDIGDGDISMAPREMEVPGIGKVKSYDLTFPVKQADGTVKPFTINSHEASLAAMSYEKQLDFQRRGVESADKAEDRAERRATSQALAEATIALREAQTARAGRSGGGGGGASGDREYRLNLQNMLSNVGKEIREVDARIKDINSDPLAKKQRASELAEMVSERSALAQRRAALNDEFVNLAESSGRGKGSENLAAQRSSGKPKTVSTSHGKVPQVTDKAAYDKLPSGTKYMAPDGTVRTKK